MLFYPNERIALFVDGANLYGAAKALQFDIDYKRVHELFAKKGTLVRAIYYTALASDAEFSPMRPMVDWLEYNGWKLVTKLMKEYQDAQGRTRRKGDMDMELAVDALELAPAVDHLVIFSGDGDFWRLVDALHRQGKRVTVVSTIKSSPPMCADELRRIADNFVDLLDIRSQIERVAKAGAEA
jgi:uncharacterized LabA/DUF88 family protein